MCVTSLVLTSEPVWSGAIVLIPPPQGKLQSRNEETWLELFEAERKRAREESTAGLVPVSELRGSAPRWLVCKLNSTAAARKSCHFWGER